MRSSLALMVGLAAMAAPSMAFNGVGPAFGLRAHSSLASKMSAPARPLRAMAGFGASRMLSDDRTIATTRMLPAVRNSEVKMSSGTSSTEGKTGGGIDVGLIVCFALWYLGNYYYNITNKFALKAAGGAAGFPITIATLQLGVGCIYALFLWAAPDARRFPKVTKDDLLKMMPVAFCSAAAHSFSVFALSAGAVSFGQIVKAAEPAFAALLGVMLYNKQVSLGKWLCLVPVIGGVVLASVKELDFAWSALITACAANLFAAFKANENAKLMSTPGIKDRLENVGNQFAFTMIFSFLMTLPVMFIKEGAKLKEFLPIWKTNPVLSYNLIASGLWFYAYNELATMTIKKTSAVTQSVANTAKRVIVIVGVAIVLQESLDPIKLLGCGIGIGGVFLYSIIDNIFPPAKKDK